MKKTSVLPWYRHPWPWILMAGPIIVIVAGAITTWLAVRSSDGLVEDDYYKQGLTVNQRIERDDEAARLGLTGELMRAADSRQLRLILDSPSSFSPPPKVALTLSHPTRAGLDQRLDLTLRDDGIYAGSLAKEITGRWHVALQDGDAKWRLVGDWNVDISLGQRLAPGSQGGSAR